jgi:hypothetical protein
MERVGGEDAMMWFDQFDNVGYCQARFGKKKRTNPENAVSYKPDAIRKESLRNVAGTEVC